MAQSIKEYACNLRVAGSNHARVFYLFGWLFKRFFGANVTNFEIFKTVFGIRFFQSFSQWKYYDVSHSTLIIQDTLHSLAFLTWKLNSCHLSVCKLFTFLSSPVLSKLGTKHAQVDSSIFKKRDTSIYQLYLRITIFRAKGPALSKESGRIRYEVCRNCRLEIFHV